MVKKNKIKREISNRLLYTLITIGILAILGFGVYALTPGVAPNPGHVITDIAPPSACGSGQFLQWTNLSSWACASAGGGGGSQWTTSGSNIYYSSGKVGIGTSNPASELTVGGNFNVVGGTSTFTGQQISLNAPITSNSSLSLGGVFPNLINGQAFSVWATNSGVNPAAFINNMFSNGSSAGIGLLVAGTEAIRTTGVNLGVYGRATAGIGVQGEGSTFDFYASGAGTNYGSPSSIRWKNNIQPINNALNIVMNLSGVSFNWDKAHGGKYDIGFIGEQVGQYLPEIVQFDKNSSNPNYYVTGMDYSKITPVLLEAIKEQQKQIDSLKLEVEQLKNK